MTRALARVFYALYLSFVLVSLSGCGAHLVTDVSPRPGEQRDELRRVKVTQITDGDTIEVRPAVEGVNEVRFIGMDTPEKYGEKGPQPLAIEAAEFTADVIDGSHSSVTLRLDTERKDDYGRALAYVYLPDGTMLNDLLIEEGYAQVATFPPNVRHVKEFRRSQKQAREARRGIWGLPENERCRLTDRGNEIGGGCQAQTACRALSGGAVSCQGR